MKKFDKHGMYQSGRFKTYKCPKCGKETGVLGEYIPICNAHGRMVRVAEVQEKQPVVVKGQQAAESGMPLESPHLPFFKRNRDKM